MRKGRRREVAMEGRKEGEEKEKKKIEGNM